MPNKPTRGPYEGSEIINYGKDPIKGYYRDIKLKSGLVRRDWNGAYDKETQARKQREEIAAEKKLGSFSNRGLQQVGENMMVLGGGGAVAGTIAALNAPTIAKKLYKFANRNNKPIPASSTKSARIGRQRELASSTTPSKIRNYTDPSTRKVRPVAGTPRIRMTRDQINERLSYEGKKGTEAMAERPPIQPGRRVISDATSSSSGSGSTSSVKQRQKPGTPTGRIKVAARYLEGFGARPLRLRRNPGFMSPYGPSGSVVDQSKGRTVEPYTPSPGRTGPAIRTTPVTRGGAEPRVPSPRLPARNTSPLTGKYSGRSTGVDVKLKTPAELKEIEDALRQRRGGATPSAPTRTGPPRRTTPVTRGGAEPRVPSPTGIASRNVGVDGKYSGRKVGYSYKEPGMDIKAIADARAARRGGSAPAPTPAPSSSPAPTRTGPARRTTPLTRGSAAPRVPSPTGIASRNVGVDGKYSGRKVGYSMKEPGMDMKAIADARAARRGGTPPVAPGAVAAEAAAAGKGAGFMGAVKKYGKLGGKVLGGIAAVAGASELYDRLAPKDYPRAPWMSRGNKPTPPAQVTQEQPFVPSPGGTSGSGGGNRGGSGGGSTMTQEARASQRAIRKPDDYLGEAFDATLRKGVNKGTAHLEHMMQMDKLDEDTRANLRNRFKKVQGDQILSQQKDKGIVERLEAEKTGRGANLLKAYRKEGGFDYGKKGDYFEIKRQAEAGTEYAK